MTDDVNVTVVALISGSVGLIVMVFGTLYSRRLRARGRRVPAAISSNIAMGWVLIIVTAVLLVSNAINSH